MIHYFELVVQRCIYSLRQYIGHVYPLPHQGRQMASFPAGSNHFLSPSESHTEAILSHQAEAQSHGRQTYLQKITKYPHLGCRMRIFQNRATLASYRNNTRAGCTFEAKFHQASLFAPRHLLLAGLCTFAICQQLLWLQATRVMRYL